MNNSDEVSNEKSQASDKFHCTGAATDTKKVCLYNESYLSIGFIHGLLIQAAYSILPCLWQRIYKTMAPAKLNWLSGAGDSIQRDFPTD
jgi:hypothetical protein